MNVVDFQNGSDANAGTWDSPFATLEHTVRVAGADEIILVKEQHYPPDAWYADHIVALEKIHGNDR